jgi:glycosyltransferase involved in cell wall biosynthesis
MNVPAVSVILPAYNCEKYIAKAIVSVLHQTFTDFEFIIINDGSTDKTEFAIRAFSDPRIIYLKNPTNKGLVFTLNRCIGIAKGKYIARMDADDICLPERLAKQKSFLDQNENIGVVATTIEFINDQEEKTGSWELDRKTITSKQIKDQLLFKNCIAHPSVMMRARVLKELKYNEKQKNIEDYDLWLRVLNRGISIAKINEPLLLYRTHEDSVTTVYLKKKNVFFRHASMKIKFLSGAKINWFSFRVAASLFPDMIKGLAKEIKNLFRK